MIYDGVYKSEMSNEVIDGDKKNRKKNKKKNMNILSRKRQLKDSYKAINYQQMSDFHFL